jgi:hypothetical protein
VKRTIRRMAWIASCGVLLSGVVILSGVALTPAQAAESPPITGGATDITETSAVLYGYIPTSEAQNSYYAFVYGRTTNYSKVTAIVPVPAPTGSGTLIEVSATITGLSPGTAYDFALVTQFGGGGSPQASAGGNMTFTTASSSTGPSGPGGPNGSKRIGRVKLAKKTLTVKRRHVSVSLSCTSSERCGGVLAVTVLHRTSDGTIVTTGCVPERVFSIGAGKTATFKPAVTRACVKLLSKASHHKLAARLAVEPATGQPKLGGARVTLKSG